MSNAAVATVAITAVNDAPLGTDSTVTTALNTPYILRTADFVFTDAENNALSAVKFTTVPASVGTLQLNTGGLGTWNTINAGDSITAADIAANRVRLLPGVGSSGNATFTFEGQGKKIEVVYGPKWIVAVVYSPANQQYICFEPMAGITNAINLNHEGKYADLQMVAPGAKWTESFWIRASGI